MLTSENRSSINSENQPQAVIYTVSADKTKEASLGEELKVLNINLSGYDLTSAQEKDVIKQIKAFAIKNAINIVAFQNASDEMHEFLKGKLVGDWIKFRGKDGFITYLDRTRLGMRHGVRKATQQKFSVINMTETKKGTDFVFYNQQPESNNTHGSNLYISVSDKEGVISINNKKSDLQKTLVDFNTCEIIEAKKSELIEEKSEPVITINTQENFGIPIELEKSIDDVKQDDFEPEIKINIPEYNPDRIHPLFPTFDEAKAHPESVYSDHLPIFLDVPLQEKGFTQNLKVLSYNVLGPSAPSGLHRERGGEDRWELDKETLARYQRIANDIIKNAIKNHDLGIIALQEAAPDMVVPELRKVLGTNWKIIEDKAGLITCYDMNKYKELKESTTYDKKERVRSIKLQEIATNKVFSFHNIWGDFNPFSYRMEAVIEKFLTQSKNEISVLAGDTNSRFALLHDERENLATGAIPPLLHQQKDKKGLAIQVPDYPDCGFYYDGEIHQLHTQVLDTQGNIFVDKNPNKERKYWAEYRMVLCLDKSYKERAIVEGKNIFQLEKDIQNYYRKKYANELADPIDGKGFANAIQAIRVRVSANSNNEKAVGIRFPIKLQQEYAVLKTKFADEQGFQFPIVDDKKSGQIPCVFVPMHRVEALHDVFFPQKNTLGKNILIGAGIGIAVVAFIVLSVATYGAATGIGAAVALGALATVGGSLASTLGMTISLVTCFAAFCGLLGEAVNKCRRAPASPEISKPIVNESSTMIKRKTLLTNLASANENQIENDKTLEERLPFKDDFTTSPRHSQRFSYGSTGDAKDTKKITLDEESSSFEPKM